jgi:hypothetical protein
MGNCPNPKCRKFINDLEFTLVAKRGMGIGGTLHSDGRFETTGVPTEHEPEEEGLSFYCPECDNKVADDVETAAKILF